MSKITPPGRHGRAWRRLAAPLSLLLAGCWAGPVAAEPAAPGLVAIEAACQPAALGAAALGALGLELATRQLDDRGFAVERWQAPRATEGESEGGGWALVLLLRDAAGGERRCLVFHRLPRPGAPA